jgi:hypothetical protein
MNEDAAKDPGASAEARNESARRAEATPERRAPERYWLVHPNGGRQLIDPRQFDLDRLAEQARRVGGRLVVESDTIIIRTETISPSSGPGSGSCALEDEIDRPPRRFEPPVVALGALFRSRLDKIYQCLEDYEIDINTRPTERVLGGYYKTRRLVRVYSHDRHLGRRPLEELFDTFLHEVAHHIEYTEPDSFHARDCGRVPGRMHSRLFWRILGELKGRWHDLQRSR